MTHDNDALDVRSPVMSGPRGSHTSVTPAQRRARLLVRDRALAAGVLMPGHGRVIALDLGTRTGIAQYDARFSERGDCIDVARLDLRLREGEGPGMRPLRFQQFLGWLLDTEAHACWLDRRSRLGPVHPPGADRIFRGGPVMSVSYERVYAHTGTIAAQVYGQLQGTLLAECAKRGIPCKPLGVAAGKWAATGNGQALKPQVKAAMSRHFRGACRRLREPDPRLSEDEGDAMSILLADLLDMDKEKGRRVSTAP